MPEFHAEPYLHLAGLSHTSALITWGAFYFKTRSRQTWQIVEDRDLRYVHPPRRESIGARSAPYGPARVNVYSMSGALAATAFTETTNFCWITGLAADTRYRDEVINRVPVYPCIGNHDTAETEDRDDRDQLLDNMYIRERIAGDEASGRASIDPGLFYRFRYGRDVESVCLDTSKEGFFRGKRLRWRLPSCHHPPFCAGPQHTNTDRMEKLLPLFASGAGSKVRKGPA